MQNDMRDRLVEMIDDYIHYVDVKKWYSEELDEGLADHLIANGVIVPPCKVGQMVWLIKPLNWQQTEWGIKEGKISMIQQKADKSWKFRVTENHSVQDYTVDKIGKTVFLTKDQAEQKLKELSGNG